MPPWGAPGLQGKTSEVRIRVRVDVRADPANVPVLNLLRVVAEHRPALMRLLRRVVLRAFVHNMRARFVQRMRLAMQIETVVNRGRATLVSPQLRLNAQKLYKSINALIEKYQDAVEEDRFEDQKSLRERLDIARASLWSSLGQDPQRQDIKPHHLSWVRGEGLFREHLLALLNLLTSPEFLQEIQEADHTTVLLLPQVTFGRLRTPSATPGLRAGSPSPSQFQDFWRHVEFGTGVKRKDSALNPVGGKPKTHWWYGQDKKVGLLVSGSPAVSFLTDATGKLYASDRATLAQLFTAELTKLLERGML